MHPIGGPDELRGDTQRLPGLAHAAFQEMRDAQPAGDRAHVFVPALELERGGARNYLETGTSREVIDQLLGQAVREVFLVFALAHVDKWQICNRLVFGKSYRSVE